MAAPPPLNLRRLPAERRLPGLGRNPENVFVAARKRATIRPLVVAFHSSGMKARPKRQSRLLVRRELRYAYNNVLSLVQSDGPIADNAGARDCSLKIRSLREPWLDAEKTPDSEVSWAFSERANYMSLIEASGLPSDRIASFLEVEGLARYGADIVVTEDSVLLAHRDDPRLRELPLMTPEEALVVVGVWSRVTHRAWVEGPRGVNNGLYYWALARAVTPAAWPGFAAFVAGERYFGLRGRYMLDLAGSILEGLSRLVRELDTMVSLWLCPPDNDVNDELVAEFDHVVTDVWRVYDNLAALSGEYLGIELDREKPLLWGLRTVEWKKAMRDTGGNRGRAIVALVSAESLRFKLSHQLRHRAIHRAAFRPIAMGSTNHPHEARIWLEGDDLAAVENAITGMGHQPEAWGLTNIDPPAAIPTAWSGDPQMWLVEYDRRGLLDPMMIAPRLVAHAAHMANSIYEKLDAQSDPRLPTKPPGEPPPVGPDGMGRIWQPWGANSAIRSSALSGLISWALPIPDTDRPYGAEQP
jgi:hypothetical protein